MDKETIILKKKLANMKKPIKKPLKKPIKSVSKNQSITTNIDTEWFQSKLKAKGISQSKLAEALGVHRSSITLLLKGRRKMSAKAVGILTQLLLVDPGEIMFKAGITADPVETEGEVKIQGFVDGELNVHMKTPNGSQTAPKPTFAGGHVCCLRFQTNGTKYDTFDGGLLYFTSQYADSESEYIGRVCVIDLGFPKPFVVRFIKRGYQKDRYNLYCLTGELKESDVDVKHAHPVVWLKIG